MAQPEPDDRDGTLIPSLRETLQALNRNGYPHIPNPVTCKKRASVALILRIRPRYDHWAESSNVQENTADLSTDARLEQFFSQEWVQNGDPEVVFIKRAARAGDRWTSHVALPGGKRDPEDESDQAVAVRETFEEIGLDLKSPHACYIGNLPERVVSTSWGKVPIMVLCPFVFVWTSPEIPPLKLQPTEVASTHWVSLRVLLSPSTRTYEYVDVSDRFASSKGSLVRIIIRSILGKMRFSAVRLIPSESLYCSSTAEFFSPKQNSSQPKASLSSRFYSWYIGDHAGVPGTARPLLLWGLTLGMMADFLDQLPPYNAVQLWSYPTFTSLDVKAIIAILTRSLKQRNQRRLGAAGSHGNQTAVDSDTVAIAKGDNPWFIGGLSDGMERKSTNPARSYAVGVMMEGYYDMARKGVWIAGGMRLLGTFLFWLYIIRRYRRSFRG